MTLDCCCCCCCFFNRKKIFLLSFSFVFDLISRIGKGAEWFVIKMTKHQAHLLKEYCTQDTESMSVIIRFFILFKILCVWFVCCTFWLRHWGLPILNGAESVLVLFKPFFSYCICNWFLHFVSTFICVNLFNWKTELVLLFIFFSFRVIVVCFHYFFFM